jgi:hypothetical protein
MTRPLRRSHVEREMKVEDSGLLCDALENR